MKIYACYSPSHKRLLQDHFLPSLPSDLEPHLLELTAQHGSGVFHEDGFSEACREKLAYLCEALAENMNGEPFLFSDVDVRFYSGKLAHTLLASVNTVDIAFQNDGPGGCCTGFMVVRPNKSTESLFDKAWLRTGGVWDDQQITAQVLRETGFRSYLKLPNTFWTYGLQEGKRWEPGMRLNPPDGILMHHGNWTLGLENKDRLLKEVLSIVSRRKDCKPGIYGAPLGLHRSRGDKTEQGDIDDADWEVQKPITGNYATLLEHGGHPVLPVGAQVRYSTAIQNTAKPEMTLVLQFWRRDKKVAMELARLIADIEPCFREDVMLVFARQTGTPFDAELCDTALHVGRKMAFTHLEVPVDESKKYPGIAFDPFKGAISYLASAYLRGALPYPNAFFFEPDGCPTRRTWINDLLVAHQQTLAEGKYLTGVRMSSSTDLSSNPDHPNGTMAWHLPYWWNTPALRFCPPNAAWDIFHGRTLLNALGQSPVIANLWGLAPDEQSFKALGVPFCWVTSVKNGLPLHWARRILVQAA